MNKTTVMNGIDNVIHTWALLVEKLLLYRMLARLAEKAVLGRLLLVPHFGYWKDPLLLQ